MHPDQAALIARRQHSAALEALIAGAGAPLYANSRSREKDGFKPAITRHARVFRHPQGKVLVEETQIWLLRGRTVNREVLEAEDVDQAQHMADEFLAQPFL